MFLHVQRLTVCIYILYHFRDIFRTKSYPPRDPAMWPHTHTRTRKANLCLRQKVPWGPRAFFGAAAVDSRLLVFGGIRTPEAQMDEQIVVQPSSEQ